MEIIVFLTHGDGGYANASQCHVTRVHYLPRFCRKQSLLSLEAVNVNVRTCDVKCVFLCHQEPYSLFVIAL